MDKFILVPAIKHGLCFGCAFYEIPKYRQMHCCTSNYPCHNLGNEPRKKDLVWAIVPAVIIDRITIL